MQPDWESPSLQRGEDVNLQSSPSLRARGECRMPRGWQGAAFPRLTPPHHQSLPPQQCGGCDDGGVPLHSPLK